MIFTNVQIAKYFSDRGLPYIYRCHKIDEKDIKEIEELKERVLLDSENEIATYLEQLKNIYPKAYYTTQNVGHVGLGVDFYSHSTSPLRRFTDIANLDSINRFVISNKTFNNDDINIYSDTLNQIAIDVNSKRSTLDDYEIEAAKKLNKTL
jgi:exoribonuclease R